MVFKVSDLKLINKIVAFSNEDDFFEMKKFLHKSQPILFDEIQQGIFFAYCLRNFSYL